MQPELLDVVELVVDQPEHALRSGARGTIVHCYSDNAYEVEFINDEGETLALCALTADQFIVVWRAATKTWTPLAERIAAIIVHLPPGGRQEVLDFAHFLLTRKQQQQEGTPGGTPDTVGRTVKL